MEKKKFVYKLGTIQSFHHQTLFNFKQSTYSSKLAAKQPSDLQHSTTSHGQKSAQGLGFLNSRKDVTILEGYPPKHRMIKKPAKGKQQRVEQPEKQKQTLLYNYFKRKLFPNTNKIETSNHHERIFDFLKLADWLMEACQNLCLSKDTFYTAVQIAKIFYSKQRNKMHGPKIIEIQVASMMSLSAKFSSNKVNYPEAVGLIHGIKKMDIIDGEIAVMKGIGFKIPLVHVQTEIVEICTMWHSFVIQNSKIIKFNTEKLIFGENQAVQKWESIGRSNYTCLCSFFDLIAIPMYRQLDYQNSQSLSYIILQALFLLVNCKNKEFFPSTPNQKTYTFLVFENFLKGRICYSSQKINQWICDLIKNEQKLKLVERIYLSLKASEGKKGENDEDSLGQSNTRTCEQALDQLNMTKQNYCKIICE